MSADINVLKAQADKLRKRIDRMPDTPQRDMCETELADLETLIENLEHEAKHPVHTPRPLLLEENE